MKTFAFFARLMKMKISKHARRTKRLVSGFIALALLVSVTALMFMGEGVQADSKPKNRHSKISGGLQDKINDAHKGKDKLVLMYSAQPLPGYNQYEQGAGQLNIKGAMRLASALKTDIQQPSLLGVSFLRDVNQPLPTPMTTTAGQTFTWAQGLVMGQTFCTGTQLLTEYQRVYGLGAVLGDGIMVTDGIMVGDGGAMGDGYALVNGLGIMVTDGIMVSDGIMVTDNEMFGDGIMVSDGIMVTDGGASPDADVLTQSATINGDDDTPYMPGVVDAGQ